MDLVDEEHIALVELGEDADEVGAFRQGRAVGDVDLGANFIGDDVSECGLSKSRRAVQQRVIDRLTALPGGLHRDAELADELFLADVLIEAGGTKRVVLTILVFAF